MASVAISLKLRDVDLMFGSKSGFPEDEPLNRVTSSFLTNNAVPRSMKNDNEQGRLQEFERVNPLAHASDASFNTITKLVQATLDIPCVAISLIDRDTRHLKAKQGFDLASTPRSEAICEQILRSKSPLAITDLTEETRFAGASAEGSSLGLRAYIGAPLVTDSGHILGALCAFDTRPRNFSAEQIERLTQFATVISELFELRKEVDYDFLTKVFNRRGFETVLRREMARLNRDGAPCTLAMLDLDHFKNVNDTFGQPVGDTVLKALTKMVKVNMRESDYLARLGGEEFALLLPNTPIIGALKVADRIRAAVAAFRLEAYPDLALTVSIGLVDISRYYNDFDAMMRDVDNAVCISKSKGRNQTTVADHAPQRRAGGLEAAE